MPLIAWEDGLKRGLGFQDADHQEAVRLMNALQTCSDDEFPGLFAEHLTHLREHLERENQLMERINFFAIEVHMDEHASILATLDDVQAQLDAGDLDSARAFAEHDLPEWFLRHLATMDTATAHFAQQRGES